MAGCPILKKTRKPFLPTFAVPRVLESFFKLCECVCFQCSGKMRLAKQNQIRRSPAEEEEEEETLSLRACHQVREELAEDDVLLLRFQSTIIIHHWCRNRKEIVHQSKKVICLFYWNSRNSSTLEVQPKTTNCDFFGQSRLFSASGLTEESSTRKEKKEMSRTKPIAKHATPATWKRVKTKRTKKNPQTNRKRKILRNLLY